MVHYRFTTILMLFQQLDEPVVHMTFGIELLTGDHNECAKGLQKGQMSSGGQWLVTIKDSMEEDGSIYF